MKQKQKWIIVGVSLLVVIVGLIAYWRIDQYVPESIRARIDFYDAYRDQIHIYETTDTGVKDITEAFFEEQDWNFKLKNYKNISEQLFNDRYVVEPHFISEKNKEKLQNKKANGWRVMPYSTA